MLKPALSILFAAICLLACEKPGLNAGPVPGVTPVDSTDTTVVTDTSTAIRTFLALGDSYTIGQSVTESERFPVQTVARLSYQQLFFKAPEIIAQTGWTTGNLLNRLAVSPPLQDHYDIVTLLIGVNNQYQQRSQDEYREQFTTLLQKAIVYAGNDTSHVFVLSIPDYSVTPFASGSNRDLIAKQIDSFNLINETISLQYGVKYIDVTPSSRLASNNLSLLAADGLHPSGNLYAVWANMLAPAIRLLFP